MITSGEGKYKVWLEEKKIGNDILFILGGGEQSHIGGVVICEPNKNPQVIRLEGHYDDVVLKPIAEAACKKYKTKVVAVGGVHVDNATKQEIEKLVENCKELVKCI
jgi:hypothetical protein